MNSEKLVNIRARVKACLEASLIGGHDGWRFGVKCNHRSVGRDDYFIGQLSFIDEEWVKPGDCAEAIGSFVVLHSDLPIFVAGVSWLVCERPDRAVGSAKLLELFPTNPALDL